MTDALLELDNLQHQWPGSPQPLLHIPHFRLQAGERLFLHGPSGSGKSTLLQIITGLQRPTAGEVTLQGTSLWQLNAAKRDHWRASQLGFISQTLNLLPYLTVEENLQLMLHFAGQQADPAWLQHLLQSLNLTGQRQQRVSQLSIGQQQRAAIARALVHRPALIIADEPTSALDDDNTAAFMQLLLQECADTGAGLLLVSHDQRLRQYFSRVCSLQELQQPAQTTQEQSA